MCQSCTRVGRDLYRESCLEAKTWCEMRTALHQRQALDWHEEEKSKAFISRATDTHTGLPLRFDIPPPLPFRSRCCTRCSERAISSLSSSSTVCSVATVVVGLSAQSSLVPGPPRAFFYLRQPCLPPHLLTRRQLRRQGPSNGLSFAIKKVSNIVVLYFHFFFYFPAISCPPSCATSFLQHLPTYHLAPPSTAQ